MFAKDKLFEGFKTGNKTRRRWASQWKRGSFDKGAERIVYSFFNTQGFGIHNSSPIGSDMFFETKDAFVHIDLKTVTSTNIPDGSGKHDIERNQTSYQGPYHKRTKPYSKRTFKANLPFSYKVGTETKPCLTYFMVIIYKKSNFDVLCMYITCMPNGCLRKHYKERVFSAAKQKKGDRAKNSRFHWKDCQKFELLPESPEGSKPKRIRVIHYDDKRNPNYKKKLTLLKQLYDKKE